MRRLIDLIQLLLEDFDRQGFLDRLRGVMALVQRGGYEGERAAARAAFERLISRAKQEVARMREPNSGVTHGQIDSFLQALDRIKTDTGSEKSSAPPPRSKQVEPKFKVGQWVIHFADNTVGKIIDLNQVVLPTRPFTSYYHYGVKFTNGEEEWIKEDLLRRATQDEVDAAQARSKTRTDDEYDILFLARYFNPSENSNKIYGIVQRAGKVYVFWGGWRKSLKVKQYPSVQDAYRQFDAKLRKGYIQIPDSKIADHYWLTPALRTEFSRSAPS